MPYKILYLEKAYTDLENILDHIAQESSIRAYEYLQFLQVTISKLADFPKLGVSCKRKKIRKECRVFIIENYLVFYKLDESSQTVTIGRVLHRSINYKRKQIF